MVDVIVIGGGIHGCSAAFHLARRGVDVHLIEKDSIGRHASGVNAGGVRQIFRALPEIPLSLAAMGMWEHISDLLEDDCGFVAQSHLFVAETESELEKLQFRHATRREARKNDLVEAAPSQLKHDGDRLPTQVRAVLPHSADRTAPPLNGEEAHRLQQRPQPNDPFAVEEAKKEPFGCRSRQQRPIDVEHCTDHGRSPAGWRT
mgnify:CR=1 FL=1